MESILEELFAGSNVSILCESEGRGKPRRFKGMPLPDGHMPFPLLTQLHFHAVDHLSEGMSVIFRTYSLPDFLNNLQWWYELALGNQFACLTRHDLRSNPAEKMYESVRKLMEAVYLVYCPQTMKFQKMTKENWTTPWDRHKPIVLTQFEFKRPDLMIDCIRKELICEHVRMELWDWLNAALAGETDQMHDPENRKNLMDFYVQADFMLENIYQLSVSLPYE